MLTLEEKSKLSGDRPTGFDYLRIILAVLIIGWHSVSVCYGAAVEPKYFLPVRPLVLFLVPCFFALSGFLVAGSLFRTQHLPTFLTLRVLRIFPALCCEVLISAFIVGAALTTLPLSEYLHSPHLRHYLRNVVGDIHYFLPGVFQSNHNSTVNSQLWTIPFELECYIAISLLYVVTLHRRPMTFLVVLFVSTLAMTGYNYTHDLGVFNFQPSGRFAVWAFLWGLALYVLRFRIKHNKFYLIFSIILAWTMLQRRELEYLAAPAIAYITIYIGLIDFKKSFILKAGDISYGLYLYGYVIQQAAYQLLPEHRSWAENFVISLAISCAFGYVSWTFVESKVLGHKKIAIRLVTSLTDKIWMSRSRRTDIKV